MNGDIGTVHVRFHDPRADELIRLLDEVRPLLRRPEVVQVRLTGHVRCSPSGVMDAFVETLQTEAEEAGKSLRISAAACPDAAPVAEPEMIDQPK